MFVICRVTDGSHRLYLRPCGYAFAFLWQSTCEKTSDLLLQAALQHVKHANATFGKHMEVSMKYPKVKMDKTWKNSIGSLHRLLHANSTKLILAPTRWVSHIARHEIHLPWYSLFYVSENEQMSHDLLWDAHCSRFMLLKLWLVVKSPWRVSLYFTYMII